MKHNVPRTATRPTGVHKRTRSEARTGSAAWHACKMDIAEQALCALIADDPRYSGMHVDAWCRGVELWYKRKIVACQIPNTPVPRDADSVV